MRTTTWNTTFAAAVLFVAGLITSCGSTSNTTRTTAVAIPSIIFETDMGNDVDDALAIDMLYKYVDQGKIRLLGISNNKNSAYSIPFLQIMNRWYGHPGIPLGNVETAVNSQGDSKDYAQVTVEYMVNGTRAFQYLPGDTSQVMSSVSLYRKLLALEPDNSVTIVSVGFSTNIARLLESAPDGYSRLTGKDLVRKKVKLLSMMAGNFDGKLNSGEYNVIKDTVAAKKVFSEWPTPIVTSPFEVGITIPYPASSIVNDLAWAPVHPLRVAYESYLPMPYDRPTWDPTAVLFAVEGNKYFGDSGPGTIKVELNGHTSFAPGGGGKHRYLTVNAEQRTAITNHFIELIRAKPLKNSL